MYKKLEKILDIKIKNEAIFKIAFTHRSAVNENKSINEHNERLEFLGDAVLELIVTEYLYKNFSDLEEGVLTSLRASLVKGESLAETAKELELGDFLKVSRGEEMFGGREKSSLLANTFESFIGAVYLDSGLKNAQKIVFDHLVPKLKDIIKKGGYIDAKSQFQQIAQAKFKITPHYKEISSSGPDHEKIFEVAVFIDNEEKGRGKGNSKQAAQQEAAKDALEKLEIDIEFLQ